MEDKMFASDKENCTARPTLGMKSMRKEVGSAEVRNIGSFASKDESRIKNIEVNTTDVLEKIVSGVLSRSADNDGGELCTPDKQNSSLRSSLGWKLNILIEMNSIYQRVNF
ncbi:hypothetical protein MKX01_039765 [Papaver californicum]|nr:hypothetical protein MKX01_039765 [Papaver californicum]